MCNKMQITKRQIRKIIQEQLFVLRESEEIVGTNPVPANMAHFDASLNGDTGLTPEIKKFLFQGQPTEELHESVKVIVSELEDGGIKFGIDSTSVVKTILHAIHKIVKENIVEEEETE